MKKLIYVIFTVIIFLLTFNIRITARISKEEWRRIDVQKKLRETFFKDDITFKLDTAIGSINVYIDDAFLTQEESDSLHEVIYGQQTYTNEFLVNLHNQYRDYFLCMKSDDGVYLMDPYDSNALISALYSPNSPGGTFLIDRYIEEINDKYKDVIDSICLYDNSIFTFEKIACDNLNRTRYNLRDFAKNIESHDSFPPVDKLIYELSQSKMLPFINNCITAIKEIKPNVSDTLGEVLKIYKVEGVLSNLHEEDLEELFYIIMQYKGNYFLCSNWKYYTWHRLLDCISIYDKDPITKQRLISYQDFKTVIHAIDSASNFKWIRIGDFNYSPKLYRRLIDAGKNEL